MTVLAAPADGRSCYSAVELVVANAPGSGEMAAEIIVYIDAYVEEGL